MNDVLEDMYHMNSVLFDGRIKGNIKFDKAKNAYFTLINKSNSGETHINIVAPPKLFELCKYKLRKNMGIHMVGVLKDKIVTGCKTGRYETYVFANEIIEE